MAVIGGGRGPTCCVIIHCSSLPTSVAVSTMIDMHEQRWHYYNRCMVHVKHLLVSWFSLLKPFLFTVLFVVMLLARASRMSGKSPSNLMNLMEPDAKRPRKGAKPKLTLGTDFSGLETPRMALENTGFTVRQLFTCDSDETCRKMASALHGDAERVYHDVQRKPTEQAHQC